MQLGGALYCAYKGIYIAAEFRDFQCISQIKSAQKLELLLSKTSKDSYMLLKVLESQ